MAQIDRSALGASPRSGASGADAAAARSREQELQEMMAEFRNSAREGIRVDMVDPESLLHCQAIFRLEPSMDSISLRPAFSEEIKWRVLDINSVFKGREFARRVPELASFGSPCLGIEFDNEMRIRCLSFPDQRSRDEFCTCLKILCTCAKNIGPGSAMGA